MKRLLAYLFIVLGLGLVINDSAEATYYCVSKSYKNINDSQLIKLIKNYDKTKKPIPYQFTQTFINDYDLWNCGKEKHKKFKLVSEKEFYTVQDNLKKRVVILSKNLKKEPSQTQNINLRNCREVNNLSGNIKFINKEDDPMILKNVNFNLSGKDISFERNKNWHYQGTKYKSKFKLINDTTIESNVISSWGGPIKVNINYKSGTIKYGEYGNIKLACEKINNNKTIFAKLLDGKSLNTKKKQRAKKKKVVKKEIINVGNSKRIKKIIKIDNKEPIKENISSWEKNVLAALEREKNDSYCEIVDKQTFKKLFKKKKGEKIVLNFCIKKSDLLKLGEYKKFNPPTFILDDLKGCKSSACVDKKAGKKVYELFVRRGSQYHARYPGDMIKGMVWFEILYQAKLKKAQKALKMYQENNYKDFMALKKKDHEKKIYSLIKLNKGRLKMRKALGFSLYDDLYEVIEGQWLLAEFLNKDKLKVSKVKLTPEMFKRKMLIKKYKTVLAKYQKKLEEEKQKKIK
jgi:hypothetical protein